jgi:hypothetical protein
VPCRFHPGQGFRAEKENQNECEGALQLVGIFTYRIAIFVAVGNIWSVKTSTINVNDKIRITLIQF